MTIEEMIKKITIEFPEPLDLDQTKDLLSYLAGNLPANISYETSQENALYHPDDSARTSNEELSVSFRGNIHNLNDTRAFDAFGSVRSTEDPSKTIGLRFCIVPGWDLSDYKPEVIKLWDDVRKIVNEYFGIRN